MRSSDLQTAKDIGLSLKTPRRRTMRQFAESEIIIPDGPFEGLRYSCSRQPCSALFFTATEDPYWNRFVALGPSQSGKSLTCFVIPTLYHLFEERETVICGLPSMDMAADKWNEDLLPVIERSKYRDLLPRSGAASKGGKSNLRSITFAHGPTLRFMSGGGDDKKRSGFTSRIVVVTETDGLDQSGGTSREADKLKQIEARTNAYGDRKRIYMECTVSLVDGRTWVEYNAGSTSRIAIRCPHCALFVSPEREHLVGWQDAADEMDAHEKGRLTCPSCGALWTEDDRRTANANARLVHKGQKVLDDGTVEGDKPRTSTFGFRWSSTNNMLVQQGTVAKAEWKASRSGDEDNAEKEMCQFWWALPYKPTTVDLTVMDHNVVMNRVHKAYPLGHVPSDTQVIALGCDVGKWLCHWVAIAFRPFATPHILDYGHIEVPSQSMAEEKAIVFALRKWRDEVLNEGWKCEDGEQLRRRVEVGFIDSRYFKKSVYAFCDEPRWILYPSMGYGSTQRNAEKFIRKSREQCVAIGEEYQLIRRENGILVEVNADHWKSQVHARLQTPMGQPGAMTLYRPDDTDRFHHLSLAKHMVAEKKTEEFKPGQGTVTKWVRLQRANHFFDATALACAAGHAAGVRPIGREVILLPQPPAPPTAPAPQVHRPERADWMPEKPSNWVNR